MRRRARPAPDRPAPKPRRKPPPPVKAGPSNYRSLTLTSEVLNHEDHLTVAPINA